MKYMLLICRDEPVWDKLREKEFTRLRDQLRAERRAMPRVKETVGHHGTERKR